ncbi:class I SAM-dependent methyltransferase [Methylobacter tundripaludum]|jgi:2-polyprenyl-3-methyl-5-hydroxy-6-metoxy-1,4-benzoquinol methylase|uniref:class I SAM-dependent methyltransferase n=1 Tax=Methylobacter tundripaludum TaxID=173365 RepID=UPI000482F06B|nr:class I SAM-dependent methyltransferase [Methylobacter tundripaludum]
MNRKEHWEAIYKSKSPVEVSWYQQKPTISLELIAKCSLSTADSIIDVGGGASTLCDYLLESGYNHLTVLDLSANALEHSKQRLGNKASSIEWQVEDVTKFSTPKHYDIWHDRAVFHFLTDESDRKNYIDVLNVSVKVGGHIIIAAFAIGGPTMCSGLSIVQYDETKLKNELGKNFTLVEERAEEHMTSTGNVQLFGYYLLVKNA